MRLFFYNLRNGFAITSRLFLPPLSGEGRGGRDDVDSSRNSSSSPLPNLDYLRRASDVSRMVP